MLSNFQAGAYLQYLVTGGVLITVTRLAGPTTVLNGLFFDPASSPQTSVQTAATLVQEDSTTEGNWIGNYGSDGYNILGNATNYPAYAKVSFAGGPWVSTSATSTTNPLALQMPAAAVTKRPTWRTASLPIDVAAHRWRRTTSEFTSSPWAPVL